ncbi:insulinase family protein [Candidatus Saganbacteria bacterium]|nr:insulinase family protein [Candidatus Saganbacteria bacterium]
MNIPQSEKTILPNGLKVLSESIPSLRSAALGIVVGAGSADELQGEEGLTHFIEHMAFKGTPTRSAFQVASELDAVGGRLNAYTSKENTVYYAVVLERHLDVAVNVLTDIFLNPALRDSDINMEKSVILEEINMYEDTPDELIHDLFAQTILHGHPAGKPTLGNKESVSSFKQGSFSTYRNRLYRPDNVLISAAGDITHKEVLGLAEKLFKDFSGNKVSQKLGLPQIKGEIKVKHKKTEQVHLCLGTKGISQIDEDRYAFSILETILGGSMSSWLFQEIREKRGLAYSIYSTSQPMRDFGIFYVYSGTEKKNLEQVIELILKQLSKMKKEGMSKEELTRAKEHIKGGLVLGLESSSARMSYIAKSEYYHGRTITVEEIFEKVDKVTLDDIIRLATEYFVDKYLTLTILGDITESPVKTLSC